MGVGALTKTMANGHMAEVVVQATTFGPVTLLAEDAEAYLSTGETWHAER
ncbi:MAG: hypothetical protein ACRDRY_21715 [Pseudonocardiaceae bacterium]